MRVITCSLLSALLATSLTATAVADVPPVETREPLMVDRNAHYRVVYNIHSDATTAGVSSGLYYARGLLEAYRNQGVRPAQVDSHLVLHGEAAFMLLKDDTYQAAVNDPFAFNPNAKIVQELLDLGVHVEICNSTMKSKGWRAEDVLPGVTIVHDAYTRIIKLQNDGYAYVGGF
ncbi:MAG: DsrE family protein [Thiobacillaceae bacterium]